MGQSRSLFRLFSSFSHSNIIYIFNFNNTNWKSVDVEIGIWTQGLRTVVADETTELKFFIRDCLLVPPLRPVNACLSMHGCLAHPAKRWYSTSSWTQNLKWKKWMARSFPPIWLTFNPNSWSLLWQENELTQSLGTSFTFQNFQPLSRL